MSQRVPVSRLRLCNDSLERARLALTQARAEKQHVETQVGVIERMRERLRLLQKQSNGHNGTHPAT